MPDRQFSDPRLADLYDLGNAGSEDRDFYLSLADGAPRDVLDLGCGTGLLSKTFAGRGHRVVGVDPASAMLDVAKRSPQPANMEWVESTSEAYRSDRMFDLIIMTGHAFQVLLSDQQILQTLQTMAQHLKPEGAAVFETRNPSLDWDSVWARAYTMETLQGPVRATRRMTDSSRAPDYLSFAWDYYFADEVLTSDSTLRFASDTEILNFANSAGLTVTEIMGDWDGSAFDRTISREMIFKLVHK
ncbi:MAG: class I SAM-dependent methyltransferase [Pseudomonadota bacterium]